MLIKSLTLDNIACFNKKTIDFSPGLNAIVGGNGSGKSSILNSMLAALTGEYSRFPGGKKGAINKLADRNSSSIRLDFQTDDETTLYRSLTSSKKYLKYRDIELTTGADIEEWLQDAIGVSKHVLSEFIFVKQWKIFDFVDKTDSERLKSLFRIFRVDRFEKYWHTIGSARNGLKIYELVSSSKEVRLKQAFVNKQIAKLEQNIANYTTEAETVEQELDGFKSVLLQHKEKKTLEQLKISLEQNLAELTSKHKLKSNKQEELSEELRRDHQELITLEKELHRLEEEDENYEAQYDKLLQSERLRRKIKSHVNVIKGITNKNLKYELSEDEFKTACKQQITKKEKYELLKELVTIIKSQNSKLARCPLCDTELSDDDDFFLESKENELTQLKQELQELHKKINAYNTVTTALEVKQLRVKEVKQYKKELKDLNAPTELNHALQDQLTKADTQVRSKRKQIKVKEDKLNNNKKILSETVIELKVNKQRLKDTDKKLSTIQANTEKLERARELETHLASLKSLLWEATTEHKVKLEQQQDLIRQKKKIAKIEEKNKKKKRLVAGLDYMRRIVSRNELPSKMVNSYFQHITESLNHTLDLLDTPFSAKLVNDNEYVVVFNDGKELLAQSLSGGQKVLFALAFRIAINSQFANNLGLLCLDEPTAGLDKRRMECLPYALQRLKHLSGSSGLQCVVVTHEESLLPYFDKVIEV